MLDDILWAADYTVRMSDDLRRDIQGAIREAYLGGLAYALRKKSQEILDFVRPYLPK